MNSLIGLIAFLFALFVPSAAGGPSVFDTILTTLFGLWVDAGAPLAAKGASFIDQIPA